MVVVSALGGITDKLIRTSQMAVEGDPLYQQAVSEIAQRHKEMIMAIVPEGQERDRLTIAVGELLEELRSIYQGVFLIRDLSPKTQAAIVSYGERMSSLIVATLVDGAQWMDSREFIKTHRQHGKNCRDGRRAGLQDQCSDTHGKADHRTDRKVDVAARQDAEQHACRQNEDITVLRDQVVDVLCKEDLSSRADREDDDDQNKGYDHCISFYEIENRILCHDQSPLPD